MTNIQLERVITELQLQIDALTRDFSAFRREFDAFRPYVNRQFEEIHKNMATTKQDIHNLYSEFDIVKAQLTLIINKLNIST